MKKLRITLLITLFAVVFIITACSSAAATTTPASTTSLDGSTIIQERCSICHPVSYIERTSRTSAEWKFVVDTMMGRGAKLTASEETVVVNYLSANFGK